MSDSMQCENCSEVGRRRRGTMCPDGWLYAECKDSETGQIMVIVICSPSCLMTFFKPGPGKLTDPRKKESDEHANLPSVSDGSPS